MTVEIRELIVQVEVTGPAPSAPSLPFAQHREWETSGGWKELNRRCWNSFLKGGLSELT